MTKCTHTKTILFVLVLLLAAVLFCTTVSTPEKFNEACTVKRAGGTGICSQCAPDVKCCGFDCNNGICGCDGGAKSKKECNDKHNGNFWCGESKPVPKPDPTRPSCKDSNCNFTNTISQSRNSDGTYKCTCLPGFSGPCCGSGKPNPTPVTRPQACCTTGTGSACNPGDRGCRAENKPGYFNMTFDLTGFEPRPGHVYIRIQRKSPSGTDFLTFPAGSDTAQVTSTSLSAGTSIVPHEYSRVVEPGDTLYFPTDDFISGRMYVSLFDPVNWLIPSIKGAGDTEPLFSTMEFTIDNGVLWVNISAVDVITMPALKLVNNKSGAWSGYENAFACTASYSPGCNPKGDSCCSLYDCAWSTMKSGCPSAGFDASWAKLFVARGASNKIGIISPKHSDEMKDYFKNYLKNTWLPSIRDNGGFYADIDYVSKKIEVSTDLVSFVVEGGEVIPTNKDSPEGYWSGGQRFWPSGSPSVLKVVSALLMSGVPIEWVCANTSAQKPFGKPMALTPEFKSQMYLNTGVVNDVHGMPMFNLYAKALHECGYCAYAYDYDDELGQDGTDRIDVLSGACLSLHIQTDDVRARSSAKV